MRRIKPVPFLTTLCLGFLLFSCSNTKYLKEDQSLFTGDKVTISDTKNTRNERKITKELANTRLQAPNSKFLGLLRTKLWIYNRATRKKSKHEKEKNFWRDKMGEPPSIFDSSLVERSKKLKQNYLANRGYFDASITTDIHEKNKKVKIGYRVDLNKPYTIKSYEYKIEQTDVREIVLRNTENSEIRILSRYMVEQLKKERERITSLLREEGYFNFSTESIVYLIDSSSANKTIKLILQVVPNGIEEDSVYHKYYVNDTYLFTDYDHVQNQQDTMIQDGQYHFIAEEHQYNPKVLLDKVFFEKASLFRQSDYENTSARLSELPVFKFVNSRVSQVDSVEDKQVDIHVFMTPYKKSALNVDFEISNIQGLGTLGSGLNTTYLRRNLLGQADLFTLSFQGVFDVIPTTRDNNSSIFVLYSSLLSINGSFTFPRFIVPFRLNRYSKVNNPTTRMSLGYSFFNRFAAYAINRTDVSLSYNWKETKYKQHNLSPTVLTFNDLNDARTSQSFKNRINESKLLASSFSDQMILGSKYSYLFNNQDPKKRNNFFNLRVNTDAAGNLLGAINQVIRTGQRPYQLLGVKFSQYVRVDFDIRRYWNFKNNTAFVGRVMSGVGVPFGNSEVLPYIKQFFAGGPNSIRAWRVRSLGPGSYFDSTAQDNTAFFDQAGDVQLETNWEYRFGIIGFLKGAVFLDVGNIWTIRQDSTRPGAYFQFDNFYNQLAIGTGFGARIDFTYFILRFDVGLPLRDPARIRKEWLPPEDIRRNATFNLAVGYPF